MRNLTKAASFALAMAPLILLGLPAAAQDAAPEAAAAAPQTVAARGYSAAQFFQSTAYGLPDRGGLAFSADGSRLLISSDESGVINTYALPIDGGPAEPLTWLDESVYAASWFPNDDRVVVTADRGGDERTHVYVRELNGGLRDLTPGDTVKAAFHGFSADGATLWISTNARDPQVFDLYAYDATTYASRLVYRNPGMHLSAISPNGRWLALTRQNSSADADVFLVDLRFGEPWHITAHQGDIAFRVFDFAPDSQSIILGGDHLGEFVAAVAYDMQMGGMSTVIQADWDVTSLQNSPSGRYRVSVLNADASTELTITDTRTGAPLSLSGLPGGDIGAVRFNRDETLAAFTLASDTSPADIYLADLASGETRRLTRALNPDIDEAQLVEGRVVRYLAHDGIVIPGILYLPKTASAANPAPAVVWVHGGPGGQSRRGWSPMIQHLVSNGYAVLAANNRGSSGYGKTFYHLDDRRHGEDDLMDIVTAGQWLRDQNWVAGDQITVMGGSYGGFLTAAALAFHPDAFAAGINIFGVTNWVRTLESIPAWWGAQRDALFDEMGDPATDAERHRAISPLFHAERITKPLLVVQGANDPRVLQVESDELVAAVRANGVPVEYLLFPDEGHGFRKKANRIAAQEAYLDFLERHVRR